MERYPRLRDLREDADLTQAQVGQALHLTQRAYAYYERAADAAAAGAVRTGAVLRRERGLSAWRDRCARALSGGEKAVRDRSAPPETAGFFQTIPAGASGAAAQKPPLRSERRFFIRFSVGPRLQRRGARCAAASAAAARARCLFPRRWPAAAAACRTQTPANSTRR